MQIALMLPWVILMQMLIIYAPTLFWLIKRWSMGIWYNGHGFLVLGVVVYLIWKELKRSSQTLSSSSPIGFIFLIPAVVLYIMDLGMQTELLSAFSLFFALPGLFLLFLGKMHTWRIFFPLLMLFFTLPIPLLFIESLISVLRHISAIGVSFLLPLVGVPVYRQGTTLHMSTVDLLVADACSGFSTLYAAVITSILFAFYCPCLRRKLILVILSPLLAIVINIIRIFSLSLLTYWKGPGVLETIAHELSGILAFAIIITLVFWIGKVPHEESRLPAVGNISISSRFILPVIFCLILPMTLTIVHKYVGMVEPDVTSTKSISQNLGAYLSMPTERQDQWVKKTFCATDWIESEYITSGSVRVRLFAAGSYDHKRLYHHPELALSYGQAFDSLQMAELSGKQQIPVFVLAKDGIPGAAYALLYDGSFVSNPIRHQLLESINSLMHGRRKMTLFYVSMSSTMQNKKIEETDMLKILRLAIEKYEAQGKVISFR